MLPKLCITPLGWPVEPDVYSSIARSSAARCTRPGSGGVRATMASQVSQPGPHPAPAAT
jgi:hypothetical protein